MNRRPITPALTLLLAALLALALAACRSEEAVLPTPEAGTSLVEATQAIYEPAPNSPFEGDAVPGTPPQPNEVSDFDPNVGPALEIDMVEVFGGPIPLPEGATPVDTQLNGPNVEAVTFVVEGMTGQMLVDYFAEALPAAGYTVEPLVGGTTQNSIWAYAGNGIEGFISIVDEAAATEPGRFVISTIPFE